MPLNQDRTATTVTVGVCRFMLEQAIPKGGELQDTSVSKTTLSPEKESNVWMGIVPGILRRFLSSGIHPNVFTEMSILSP